MNGPAPPLLNIEDLSVSYPARIGRIRALRNFHLEIGAGESHGIAGESGSGKSTLALAILRYLGAGGRIDSGHILFDGADILRMDGETLRRLRKRDIALIPQDPLAALNPVMRIGDQLTESSIVTGGVARGAAIAAGQVLLERLNIEDPGRLMRSYPHELSGGQQQRVLIAMALMGNPRLLLLDEPATGLDASAQVELIALLRKLTAERGIASLFISHDLDLVARACSQVTIMYAGEAMERGTVSQVLAHPIHPYTRALLAARPTPSKSRGRNPLRTISGQASIRSYDNAACSFFNRCPHALQGLCNIQRPMLHSPDTNNRHEAACLRIGETGLASRDLRPYDPADSTRARKNVPTPLELSGVSKIYRAAQTGFSQGTHAQAITGCMDIDLNVRTGEILAIVGKSGSGKSTLAKLMLGIETPDAGSILLRGEDVTCLRLMRRPPALRRNIQMVFQNHAATLNPSLTIGYQLQRALRFSSGRRSAFANVPGMLDAVGLPASVSGALPDQLSGGQKQRVALARALAVEPSILIADEAVSALDVSVQASIVELLVSLQRRFGLTLIFISHDLPLVRYIADRVAVMHEGRIVEIATAQDLFAQPRHAHTRALLEAAAPAQ